MDILAIAIFAAALTAIALDWTHRTIVALAGAALMVVLGVLDQEQAIESIDWATLGLLAGMMIIVGLVEPTGRLHVLRAPRRAALPRPPGARCSSCWRG